MRAVVADDTLLTREGVVALLTAGGVDVVAQAGDATTLMSQVRVYRPDVCVVDIRMPPTHTDEGLVAATAIRSEFPGTGVLVLSHYIESAYALRLIQDQPEGSATSSRIGSTPATSSSTASGGWPRRRPSSIRPSWRDSCTSAAPMTPSRSLSEREREVLALVAEGLTNQGIGRRLFITDRTVEAHVRQIFTKLGLDESSQSNRRVLAVLTYLRSA